MKLSLYQVAAVVEVEIYFGGEGDDVRRAQIPAEGSKGRDQRWGLCYLSPPTGQQGHSPSAPSPAPPPPPRLPVPQALIVSGHAEASLVVREVAG